jgi:hypothetical protein
MRPEQAIMSSDQDSVSPARPSLPFANLRRFARPRPTAAPCDLCGTALRPEHQHLLNTAEGKLLCACDACVILLSGGEGARFRQVPRRIEFLPEFRMTDSQWNALGIPIELAFFFHRAQAGKIVALYPGPAGVTQSSPPAEAWCELEKENPALGRLQADVEALLISRLRQTQCACVVPIDECYRLSGLIRTRWRGFSGGTEVWQEVGKFFDELKRKSQMAQEARNA